MCKVLGGVPCPGRECVFLSAECVCFWSGWESVSEWRGVEEWVCSCPGVEWSEVVRGVEGEEGVSCPEEREKWRSGQRGFLAVGCVCSWPGVGMCVYSWPGARGEKCEGSWRRMCVCMFLAWRGQGRECSWLGEEERGRLF